MVEVRILDYKKDIEEIKKVFNRSSKNIDEIEPIVKEIISKVKGEGDKALVYYANKFDYAKLDERDLVVSEDEIKDAFSLVSEIQIVTIKSALNNIRKFSFLQKPKPFFSKISKGISAGVMIIPIEKVGCYIPAGKYPLLSTALMTVIPAKVAGVKEIIVSSPPQKDGKINPAIIVASILSGATKIVKAGGAQAIAALAYGTETIPKVDKIVGPGNIYVTCAKKLVYGVVGIDMLAGPSEIVIIATEKSNSKFIASDMLAQAEHDPLACAILFTDSQKLADDVKKEIELQAEMLSTKETIERSFENCSSIVIVDSIEHAISFSNEFAPEHLELIGFDKSILRKIKNAGSIFIGEYSCEAAGDYCSGPNHVLPTGQSAKFRAGLSVYDFLKMTTVQMLTKDGLSSLKDTISELADMENLPAHKSSVLKKFEGD